MYEIFAKLLEKFDVKAADVSKATGLPSSLFSEWKKGKSNPKADKLQKIADYFGVSLNYLLTGYEKEATNVNQINSEMYNRFDQLLQKYNTTPYKVSKITGISTATLSDWKNGKSEPKRDKIQKICDHFGLPIFYFYQDPAEKEASSVEKEITPILKNEREIGYDLDRIMEELEKDVNGPLFYKGAPIDDESLDILVKALELRLARVRRNKKQ